MDEKRFALLIDSDNVSAGYINNILDELSQYGIVSYKRIYGDWNSTNSKKWRAVLSDYALQPMQQFAHVKGKNATDSFMIIDAMDILYSNTVDGFCLVTSDSDFTRLAARLRESGKTVIGMGESKTAQSFVSACDNFVNLENFRKEDKSKDKKATNVQEAEFTVQSKEEIEKWIMSILVNMDGKRMNIGEIGDRLRRRYSNFDYRNYTNHGHRCNNLSSFLNSFETIILQEARNGSLEIASAMIGKVNLKLVIKELLADGKPMDISVLGIKIREKIPEFSSKDYGFAQFKQFMTSLQFVTVAPSDDGKAYYVILKK